MVRRTESKRGFDKTAAGAGASHSAAAVGRRHTHDTVTHPTSVTDFKNRLADINGPANVEVADRGREALDPTGETDRGQAKNIRIRNSATDMSYLARKAAPRASPAGLLAEERRAAPYLVWSTPHLLAVRPNRVGARG